MVFQWSKQLSVGVEQIDEQHKELFHRISRLIESSQEDASLAFVFEFLEKYVEVHFALEETYMERYDYPKLSDHENEHTIFWENYAEIRQAYNDSGVTEELTARIKEHLCDWLVKHILKVDMELGNFLKTKL
ncbi:MAG: bacteriohemerythrin [Candidatus Magnetoovum sp. WYHC-5]|nr:bacteriohemerythrin [Candidatus Magnetoovum sp. WYHC-5]